MLLVIIDFYADNLEKLKFQIQLILAELFDTCTDISCYTN